MSSVPLDQDGDSCDGIPVDSGEDASPEIPLDCSDPADEFGEPEIPPKTGEAYQVDLPPLIEEPYHLQDFIIGLPLPLTWISCSKHEGPETISDSKHPDFKNVSQKKTSCNGETTPSYYPLNPGEELQSLPIECSCEGHRLVPELTSKSWSDAEKASFLLALYIFEKNFVEVRQFVETKDMGAILSFFYGRFYGSDEHRRWSEGRKSRTKKCVYGQRIFSGSRHQELLSRLIAKVSEESKSFLLEVSKTFGDDKISLVEYISSLKDTVGMNILVEAVAIGKGKQDLTGMGLELLRSHQAIPARPEIPAGKACSSLTSSEIIKFLSGDYRLSKARSNDLFWEAVWPRLLARGWHSEQPQNQGYIAGSNKHFLVFLVPGVKKFSRRKLVRGDHYFDSITDVLSKVAKEPGLIELENDEEGEANNNREDEHHFSSEMKVDDDENNPPIRQRHSYLQPRTPNRSMEAIKFTIVDTSLSDGNVRELRTLPSQISNIFIPLDHPEESDESDTTDNEPAPNAPTTKHSGKCRKSRDDSSSSVIVHTVYPSDSKSSVRSKNKDVNANKKPRKVSKSLLSQKQKTVDGIVPLSKRCRRLTGNGETGDGSIHSSTTPRLENGVSCSSSGFHESNENLSTQDKMSSTSSSKGSPCESIEPSSDKPRSQLLIDLNLPHPQASGEYENDGLVTNEPDDQSSKQVNQSLPNSSVIEARIEEQAVVNPRRLSTRYRPPTARALEAVANGFLTVPQRRKGRDIISYDGQAPRPSQRPRVAAGPNESPSSSVASQAEEAERGGASSSVTLSTTENSHPKATEEAH